MILATPYTYTFACCNQDMDISMSIYNIITWCGIYELLIVPDWALLSKQLRLFHYHLQHSSRSSHITCCTVYARKLRINAKYSVSSRLWFHECWSVERVGIRRKWGTTPLQKNIKLHVLLTLFGPSALVRPPQEQAGFIHNLELSVASLQTSRATAS